MGAAGEGRVQRVFHKFRNDFFRFQGRDLTLQSCNLFVQPTPSLTVRLRLRFQKPRLTQAAQTLRQRPAQGTPLRRARRIAQKLFDHAVVVLWCHYLFPLML